MAKKSVSFRVGKVLAYLRGQVWYLCYHEHGRRRRPRVGPDKEAPASSPPRLTPSSNSARRPR